MVQDQPTTSARKKSNKNQIVINLQTCKYEILRNVATQMQWREATDEEPWDLYWTDLSVSEDRVVRMSGHQKINHFPAMSELCRKCNLARNMRRLKETMPEEFKFYPDSYVLPGEGGELKSAMTRCGSVFVVKPDAGCQGRGIFLVSSAEDLKLQPGEVYVAQKYIDAPLLIDKLKFDLRIYVLVTSCDPLRIFVHEEGLARFCTEEYKTPDNSNATNTFMHLTNYAINKHHQKFVQGDAEVIHDAMSHKRRVSTVFEIIEQQYGKPAAQLWPPIYELIVKTLMVGQPLISRSYRRCVNVDQDRFRCFELLGFDILLDSSFEPHLLEVNHSPSFSCDSSLDSAVKEQVLSDVLTVVNLSKHTKRQARAKGKHEAEVRLYAGIRAHNRTMTAPQDSRDDIAKQYVKQTSYQDKHKGGFVRIYPNDHDAERWVQIQSQIGVKVGDVRHLGYPNTASQWSNTASQWSSSSLERLAISHALQHEKRESGFLSFPDYSSSSLSAYNFGYFQALERFNKGGSRRPLTAAARRSPSPPSSRFHSPSLSNTRRDDRPFTIQSLRYRRS